MDIQWSKSRMFRYEACWAKQKDPQNIIKQVWRVKQKSSSPWDDVQNKLLGCKKSLKKWVRKNSCPVKAQIRSKEQQLRDIQLQETGDQMGVEMEIMEELNELLAHEALKWPQRAKENWLKYGDRNSKIFHAAATQKNRRSRISVNKDKCGQLCKTQVEIEEAFVLYFQEIFTGESQQEVDQSIQAVDQKVSDE